MRYHARWVLPITQPPIENGTVVESDGVISYVGPRATAPAGEDVDLGDSVLMPGLVNAHTHLELTVMRGFLEDCRFTAWIDKLRQSRNDALTDEMLLDSARFGIVEGLAAGVTTYADTCSSGVVMTAMREQGVRGVMYQEVFGPDPADADAAVRDLEDRVAGLEAGQTDLVRLGISPHAPYTVSDELYAAAARFAHSRGLPLAMHVAESDAEQSIVVGGDGDFAASLRKRGIDVSPRARSPIALLERCGALERGALLIHCVRADDDDIEIMARRSCSVAHCPASNAKFGHGIAPILSFIGAGIPVGIGSDSVASNNRMDILDEARLAVLIHRAATRRHDAFGADEALELATLGGARALGLESRIGSLEVGKDADLAAFRTDTARTTPLGDPYAAAVFALPGRTAELVAVRGRVLVDRGRVLGADKALVGRVNAAGTALATWMSRRGLLARPSPVA
ncbi:MAG TPA: amidohydrolase family protein [Gemmatimonadaceae bacterium]|nr:amidohydrolase family protein [Gemmatimonadaceae bacterium]